MMNIANILDMPPQDAQIFFFIMTIYAVIFGILAIFGLVSYLLKGIGMYGIAKKLQVPHGWMSFIPIVSVYYQGELSGDIQLGKRTIKNPGLWTIIVGIVASGIGIAIYLVSIITLIMQVAPHPNASFDTISSSLIPFFIGIFAFVILISIGSVVTYVLTALMRYQIHKKYVDENRAVFHMIMGLFVPLYQSIYFFILRKKEPLSVAPFPDPAPEPPSEIIESE